MFDWIKKYKKISIGIVVFLFLFFIILMPLILNTIYYLDAPCAFFSVGYDISNILDYYGSIMTFIGTIILGSITVYQNYLSQKKTEEVNKLTLELQKKSMALAEQNYNKEKLDEVKKSTPKFELKIGGCNGYYMNLSSTLKNVSEVIVSGIKSVSFEVIDESDSIVTNSDKVKSKVSSLYPGQETQIDFNNIELKSNILVNLNGRQVYDSLKNFKIIWRFQCEDSISNIHYYEAILYVKDSNEFKDDMWKVQKVG